MERVTSWGNTLRAQHAVIDLDSRFEPFPSVPEALPVLPFGNGRSYGDCCLNPGGALVRMRRLDRFIRFDRERGILECEAGVLLEDILRLVVPAGWFLPVTPGTRLVTVGGAIANDVHGKNHHRAGTFGCHVRRLTLLRSDRGRLDCSETENPELLCATIGGLGLTGLILSAEIVLRPITGPRGRLYPAKDARMPGALYRTGYPRWREFAALIDPRCSSGFWRRVAERE